MSVLQKRLIKNDPPPRLCTKDDRIRVVEEIPTDSSSRSRESGLSFRNDFTCDHSLPGTQFNFTEIPGIF